MTISIDADVATSSTTIPTKLNLARRFLHFVTRFKFHQSIRTELRSHWACCAYFMQQQSSKGEARSETGRATAERGGHELKQILEAESHNQKTDQIERSPRDLY